MTASQVKFARTWADERESRVRAWSWSSAGSRWPPLVFSRKQVAAPGARALTKQHPSLVPGHDAAVDIPDGAGDPPGCRFLSGTRTAAGRPCVTAVGIASAHRGGAGANADGSGVATWPESTSTMSSRMGRSRLSSSSCSAKMGATVPRAHSRADRLDHGRSAAGTAHSPAWHQRCRRLRPGPARTGDGPDARQHIRHRPGETCAETVTSRDEMRPGAAGCAQPPAPPGMSATPRTSATDRPGALSRLLAERHATPRKAFTQLPPCCQKLIALLTEDPPVRDARSSVTPGIPADSIRTRRRRCLDKLRLPPGHRRPDQRRPWKRKGNPARPVIGQ